jgi:hypothetical protein
MNARGACAHGQLDGASLSRRILKDFVHRSMLDSTR